MRRKSSTFNKEAVLTFRGYKFAGGLIDLRTSEEINLPTERDIFAALNLRYVPPPLRNADG